MFQDMLDAREAGREPMETFRDGYVVNAIIDACYKSMKSERWEPVEIDGQRPRTAAASKIVRTKPAAKKPRTEDMTGAEGAAKGCQVMKTERLPDGRVKRILKDKTTGRVVERIE